MKRHRELKAESSTKETTDSKKEYEKLIELVVQRKTIRMPE